MGAMIDDGVERGAPSGQPAPGIGMDEADRAASRRRIIIASLLTPPTVMTLGSPGARAGKGKDNNGVSRSAMRSREILRSETLRRW
jgi:hypothetical protein